MKYWISILLLIIVIFLSQITSFYLVKGIKEGLLLNPQNSVDGIDIVNTDDVVEITDELLLSDSIIGVDDPNDNSEIMGASSLPSGASWGKVLNRRRRIMGITRLPNGKKVGGRPKFSSAKAGSKKAGSKKAGSKKVDASTPEIDPDVYINKSTPESLKPYFINLVLLKKQSYLTELDTYLIFALKIQPATTKVQIIALLNSILQKLLIKKLSNFTKIIFANIAIENGLSILYDNTTYNFLHTKYYDIIPSSDLFKSYTNLVQRTSSSMLLFMPDEDDFFIEDPAQFPVRKNQRIGVFNRLAGFYVSCIVSDIKNVLLLYK